MKSYDVIIVGARCAGSPTAMLLAAMGYRVLLLDRARFPSDVLSAHYIHNSGIQRLERWGLLDRVIATGCPPISRLLVDLGPGWVSHIDYGNGSLQVNGQVVPMSGAGIVRREPAYAPRRRFLDTILVEAAIARGAELREEFTVRELIVEEDRVAGVVGGSKSNQSERIHATIVIGADGLHSTVANLVKPKTHKYCAPLTATIHSYWSGLDLEGMEAYFREGLCVHIAPTNDGLSLVGVSLPNERSKNGFMSHLPENFEEAVSRLPDLAKRMDSARREEPFYATAHLPNYLRQAYGPGWALVGDAGYNRDPIMGQGITNAFQHAELLSSALHAGLSGERPMSECLAQYEAERDRLALPMYEAACQLAQLLAPSPTSVSLMQMFDAQYESTATA